jgi:hypothetical protein
MAILPGEQDLGRTPAVSGDRAIGAADASGAAVGAAAIAQGATNLGKGISELGTDIGAVAGAQSRFELARWNSDYLTKETQLRTSLAQDTDYTTLPTRYQEQATKLRDAAAANISTPSARQTFLQSTNVSIAQGVEGMTSRAQKMASDANGAWTSQTNNTLIDQATAIDDPVERAKYIDAGIANIDARVAKGEIGPTEALAAKQAFAHQYVVANAITTQDPQGALNEVRAAPGSGDAVTNRILQIEGTGQNGKSSATGTGQFVDGTWLDEIKRNRPDLADGRTDDELLALRNDPTLARQMTDTYRQENVASLTKQGIQATAGNQYLAHFLGPGGAAAMIKADPTMPAIDALTAALGEKKAQAMVDANPTVLNSLAGHVVQWADGRMGGAGAHDSIYSNLPPGLRGQVAQMLQERIDKQTATDTSTFQTKVEDTLAEAGRNGSAQQPVSQAEFIKVLGGTKGLDAYSDYTLDMKLRSDVSQVARLTPQQQNDLVKSYDPKPGEEGFSDQNKRQAQLQVAIQKVRKERDDDPAQFAISRIPSVKDAYGAFSKVQADPTAPADAKQAAARDFVNKTVSEQQKAGVAPDAVKILPDAMASKFNDAVTHAASSDDPNARTGLIKLVQDQAALYGDNWPLVYRQLAPKAIPVVRAIAAGADTTAMTRLLNLGPEENPAALLKEQSETKAKDVQTNLNTAMAPLLQSMVGRQKDRDFGDYYTMANKLAALYVRDGLQAPEAATKAFNDLIGNRYDFRDTYRIPKSPAYSADDVQAGALVAKSQLAATMGPDDYLARNRPFLKPGDQQFSTPLEASNEKSFRDWVSNNKVPFDPNSRTADYDMRGFWKTAQNPEAWKQLQASGKIPTDMEPLGTRVDPNDGKPHFPDYWKTPYHQTFSNESQWANESAPHWTDDDKLVSPAGKVLFDDRAPKASALLVKPAIDDIGGLSDARGDSVSKFKRDGVWVTSPRNDGLNLMYGDKAVRGQDGAPMFVPWGQLARLGGSPEARADAMKRATQFSEQTP